MFVITLKFSKCLVLHQTESNFQFFWLLWKRTSYTTAIYLMFNLVNCCFHFIFLRYNYNILSNREQNFYFINNMPFVLYLFVYIYIYIYIFFVWLATPNWTWCNKNLKVHTRLRNGASDSEQSADSFFNNEKKLPSWHTLAKLLDYYAHISEAKKIFRIEKRLKT